MGRQRLASRFALLMLVVGSHGALVLLWLDDRLTLARVDSTHRRSTLVIVPLPPITRAEPALSKSPPRNRQRHWPGAQSTPPVAPPLDHSIHAPPIDWRSEGARAAERMAPQLGSADPKCKNPSMPALLPPECRPRDHAPHWTPEPTKVGVEGLLPYVRLGKRCVVGLGFFGCAIGDLPEADGHALDHMHDPDRPTSSAPDNTADR